jgi:aspartyl-tRNA(Asn)/glutamyl-tRNA(Gln) amidotransferase subunit A
MSDPPRSIAAAARLIRDGTLSPVDLTDWCLDRIARLDGALHSFVTVLAAPARDQAVTAEAEIKAGGWRGPLHGIPIGLKDVFETKGVRTTGQSRSLANYIPTTDSTVAQRLAAAGAILLGKQTTHEFALGGPSFELPWPPARNPWDTTRFTGSSSSGTGAAVAAGLSLGGIGSDTGGSVRLPAALCGVSGLRPTTGRIGRAGLLPLAASLDTAGPIARTVEDCALLLQAIAGPDPDDPTAADIAVPDYQAALGAGVAGLRIGVLRSFHETDLPVQPAVLAAVDAAAAWFGDHGAAISEIRLSPLQDYNAAGYLIMLAEGFAHHAPGLARHPGMYGASFRDRISLGMCFTAEDVRQARQKQAALRVEMLRAFEDVDLLLTATAPGEAPPIETVTTWGIFDSPSLTMPFSLTGCPALSLCGGFGPTGLPLSLQLAAAPFHEAKLMNAGHAFQQGTEWHLKLPG